MFTDSAQHQEMDTTPGLVTRVTDQVRQFICSLHGHDSLLHFEHGRISLLCSSCGYETPGWDVKTTAVRREVEASERRLVRMPLVGERRIA
jgi:hypothetical protein